MKKVGGEVNLMIIVLVFCALLSALIVLLLPYAKNAIIDGNNDIHENIDDFK